MRCCSRSPMRRAKTYKSELASQPLVPKRCETRCRTQVNERAAGFSRRSQCIEEREDLLSLGLLQPAVRRARDRVFTCGDWHRDRVLSRGRRRRSRRKHGQAAQVGVSAGKTLPHMEKDQTTSQLLRPAGLAVLALGARWLCGLVGPLHSLVDSIQGGARVRCVGCSLYPHLLIPAHDSATMVKRLEPGSYFGTTERPASVRVLPAHGLRAPGRP
jgi:hypothetical protein